VSELPHGWARAKLGDICLPVEKHDPRKRPDDCFVYIDIGGIENQRIIQTQSVNGAEAPSRARQLVRAGDTVVSTVRTYLKKTAFVSDELDGATASTGFCVLRPAAGMETRFVFYRVIADDFVSRLTTKQTGSSYPAVRDHDVLEEEVMVPPQAEQSLIVAAIEEQFSRLDAADALLDSASRRAIALRESVLAAACSGEWPARKVGDVASLTDGPFGSNLKTSHYVEAGPRVVRLQNIGDGFFRDERAHITDEHFNRLAKHEVVAGDIVAASLGDNAPRACLVPAWLGPAIVKADCIRIRSSDDVAPSFLMWALNSPPLRAQAATRIKGIGRPRLGLGGIRDLMIPLPPLEEQRRIVGEVEQRLSVIDTTHETIATVRRRSASLRRSILEQAFSGKLVPQDPSDEPASALLERIASERAAAPKPSRRKRKIPA
jgi:type I restriction enzyme, S subunit